MVGGLKDDILLDFDFFRSDSFCHARRREKTPRLPLVPADTLPGLAEQTSLSAPCSSALGLPDLQDSLWLELRRERGSGDCQGWNQMVRSTDCPPRSPWSFSPLGQARFKAAEMETWAH